MVDDSRSFRRHWSRLPNCGADPLLSWPRVKASLGLIEATCECVVAAFVGAWLNIRAFNADGRRTEEVVFDRVGCVRHLNKVEVGIDMEVGDHMLHERHRVADVCAAIDVEDLETQRRVGHGIAKRRSLLSVCALDAVDGEQRTAVWTVAAPVCARSGPMMRPTRLVASG